MWCRRCVGKTIEVKTRANVEVTPAGDAGGDTALEQLLASVQGGSSKSAKAAKPAAEKQTQLERLTAANPVGDARDFTYLQQFSDRISYLEELAKTASQKEYIALQQQIKQTERLRKAFAGEGDLSWEDARSGRLSSVKAANAASYAFGSAMRELPKALPKDFKLNNPLPTKEIKKDSATISQCLDGLGVAMGNLSGALGDNAGAWLSYASNVLQSVAKMIPALLALTSAEFAEKSSALPPPLNVINMVASMAAVAAAFASLPKFADGGIAYGPTVGVFGEYPGASNNPEVVAPLNKLKDLIAPAVGPGVGGEVTFRIEGRDLVGVITKYKRYNSHVK